jgi:hypothetical protein
MFHTSGVNERELSGFHVLRSPEDELWGDEADESVVADGAGGDPDEDSLLHFGPRAARRRDDDEEEELDEEFGDEEEEFAADDEEGVDLEDDEEDDEFEDDDLDEGFEEGEEEEEE